MITLAKTSQRLPASAFCWQKFCCKRGWAICQLVDDFSPLKLKPGVTLVGWIPANELTVRPRTSGFAIMVEIDGEDTWLHCAELTFDN